MLLDVDDRDGPGSTDEVAGPAMVVVRRDGVPVGSMIVAAGDVARLTRRSGPPLAGPVTAAVPITVAVCTRDRPERLARCLDAVRRAVELAGHEVAATIVVVDNASVDDRTRQVAVAAGAAVVREPVPGLDLARNRAVAMAGGDVVAFTDDDVVVDPTWLRTLARTFDRYPDALAVTGGVLALTVASDAQFEFERCGGFFKGWTAGVLDEANRDDLPFNPSMGVGCNMAFRRRALDAAGPFDEALDTGPPLAGGGDLDMLVRVAKLGSIVYEPSAVVRHEHRASMVALRQQYLSWGKSWGAVLHKWYRASPADRATIRRAAARSLRHYLHDVVLPGSPGRRRRGHAGLMLVGFAAGVTTAYPRSRQRIVQRRRIHAHVDSSAASRRARQ
jgi:GT2 family glycosyltransferase